MEDSKELALGLRLLHLDGGLELMPELATVIDEEAGKLKFRGQTCTYEL
jgi:hypothetical protein